MKLIPIKEYYTKQILLANGDEKVDDIIQLKNSWENVRGEPV